MRRMVLVSMLAVAMGGGVVLARGASERAPRAAAYEVDPRWADEAQQTSLAWPTLRGTCRIERPVADPQVTFG